MAAAALQAPGRRLFLRAQGALAGSILALLLALSPPAGAAQVTARSADSFVDSIGVNTHTAYTDTVYYSRFATVKQRLAELGVRHIREDLVPDRPDQYERLNQLAQIGVRSTLILGRPDDGAEGLGKLVSILRTELRGSVAAAEGANEYDMAGGADWRAALVEHQRQLHHAVRSDPALAHLPVIGPSIVQPQNMAALGNISGSLDYGNLHPYPDGLSPESNLDQRLADAALNSAGKPVMATETGYHTALGWRGEHRPVSEGTMATYIPRLFLEYFRRGVARTFSYELLDQGPGQTEREDTFGLLRNDLSPKPAFAALRNLIGILEDPGGPVLPTALDLALQGDTRDLRHVLLQKRDGSLYLALWRASEIWDPNTRTASPGHSGPVTVRLGQLLRGAEVFAPGASAAPLRALPIRDGRSVSIDVGPEVRIVRLDPEDAAGRIRIWVSKRTVPPGGRVAVRARLPEGAAGTARMVKIQHRRNGKWRTVERGRASRRGHFRKALRLSPTRFGRVPKLRVVAAIARPSRSVRLRIRKGAGQAPPPRIGLGARSAVSR